MNDEEIKNESFDKAQDDSGESDVSYVESTEDGEALPVKDVAKKLREEIKQLQKEKEEYLTGWQRAKADYINLQKEMENSKITTSILTKEKMTDKLLPALDSFEMAFSNKDHWEKIDKDWQNGITSIYQQLISGLEKSGIEKIDEVKIPFDPSIHQSISIVATDDEKKDHTVEKILQVGYKIGDSSVSSGQSRVIRPAKVSIYEYRRS